MDKGSVMVTIYAYDKNGVYTNAAEVDPMGEVPAGLMTAPPALTGTQVAQAVGGAWVVLPEYPKAPLLQRQTAAWERIKHERDRRKFAGVKVGTDWFHCDTDSRGQWERMVNRVNTQGLVDSAGYTIGGQPVPWKTMTGSFVILTAGKIRAVVDAVELQEAMIFGRAEMHRVAMEASSTPESYDFSTGWPASIEDAP